MEKGYVPEKGIQFGRVRARVIEETALPMIRRVLSGIEDEGLTVQGAFARYFNEKEVNQDLQRAALIAAHHKKKREKC
jgi:hypothetical protein